MADDLSPTVQLQGVKKAFGRVLAVDGLDVELMPGEFVGFVGPNGAGKSTTIKMLTGQLVPTEGAVHICGVDVAADPAAARRHMGYVPEFPTLYEYLTAREMIDFVAEIRGVVDRAPAVEQALQVAGLGADADRLIHEYSQGMHRKTALACALVATPPVLVLDEALNGLDPPSSARVVQRLHQACEAGATVLLSTHVLDTLEKVADRILMIRDGRIVADVPPSQLDAVRGMFT